MSEFLYIAPVWFVISTAIFVRGLGFLSAAFFFRETNKPLAGVLFGLGIVLIFWGVFEFVTGIIAIQRFSQGFNDVCAQFGYIAYAKLYTRCAVEIIASAGVWLIVARLRFLNPPSRELIRNATRAFMNLKNAVS